MLGVDVNYFGSGHCPQRVVDLSLTAVTAVTDNGAPFGTLAKRRD